LGAGAIIPSHAPSKLATTPPSFARTSTHRKRARRCSGVVAPSRSNSWSNLALFFSAEEGMPP
jgi:hypothetical protein